MLWEQCLEQWLLNWGMSTPGGTWINSRGYANKSVNEFSALNSIKMKFRYRVCGKRSCSQTIQYNPIFTTL